MAWVKILTVLLVSHAAHTCHLPTEALMEVCYFLPPQDALKLRRDKMVI